MHRPRQSTAPVGQPPPEQRPLAHDWPPGHTRPQPPQFVASVARLAQSLPHNADPAGQAQIPVCGSQVVP